MGQTLSIVLPFFALIGCGWLAARRGLISDGAGQGLTLFVFTFALPALIFRAAATQPLSALIDLPYLAAYTTAGLFVFAASAVVGGIVFKTSFAEAAVQGQAASVGNVGFLALPLLLVVIGERAVPPVMLGWMVDMIVLVPLAIVLLEAARHSGGSAPWFRTVAKILRGVLGNPIVLSLIAGIIVNASPFSLPLALDTFTDLLGRAAGPTALFALGVTLAGRPLSASLVEASYVSAIKLFIYPAVMWVVTMHLFGLPPFQAIVATLIAAAPVASNVYVIAAGYQTYAMRASTAVLVSTGVAVVSFTALIAWALPRLGE